MRGAVLGANLLFESTHGTTPTVPFGAGGAINLDLDGSGSLGTGYRDTGTLTISEGVLVASTTAYMGYWSGSQGSATVTGSGSKWTNSSDLHVGREGSGMLLIADGARVSNSTGHLGYAFGSNGSATVTGNGSTWAISAYLFVGRYGTGTLAITDGGQVSSSTCYLGRYADRGTLAVVGSGARLTTVGLHVGSLGSVSQ